MIKKITFLFFALLCSMSYVFAQTTLNNFEDVNPTVDVQYGATFASVANPNPTGNTSSTVGQLGRTTANWFELIRFPITSYNVPANTIEYLHVLVHYPAQPDVSVRFDASLADLDGTTDVRAMNTYTNLNQWQDLVFELDGGASGITVDYIVFLFDLGFNNVPAGQLLNNTDTFAYVDNFFISSSSTPVLSNDKFTFDRDISIYPNPATSSFKISANNDIKIKSISLYDVLGNKIEQNSDAINSNTYDISDLSSGLYMVKITDDRGGLTTKRLIKR